MAKYDPSEYDPWQVREEHFPTDGMPAEQLHFLLNYAVLAPSVHNTQPWLFRLSGDEVALHADRRRALAVIDPEDRQLIMSCGAALQTLRVAARHFGYRADVRTFPDMAEPDLLAHVRLGDRVEPTVEDHRLFAAIRKRRTVRRPFREEPVEPAAIERLVLAARSEGATLAVLDQAEARNALADIVADADRKQCASRSFRRELAAWIHPNRSSSRDGIPVSAMEAGRVMSMAAPFAIRTFDLGRGLAARDRQLVEGSPIVAVLTTDSDGPTAWLDAGQALSRVLLAAVDLGIYASFLNQAIEEESSRPAVAKLVSDSGRPQVVMRMGYGDRVRPTPRRAVSDVLVS